MKPISVHEFIWDATKYPAAPVCVVYGDDPFLKSHAVRLLRDQVLRGEDAEFSLTRFEGDAVGMNTVLTEVSTTAMFGGGRRFVLIEDADAFVTKYRPELEDYADRPSSRAVLTLLMQSFPSNTRLFKKLVETGLLIEAKTLPEKDVPGWIVRWSKRRHKTPCDVDAAERLLDRVGTEHGLLDQELAKLALMVPPGGRIDADLVDKAVGAWRSRSTFEMLDAVLAGQTAAAVRQLDQLLLAGENPIGILAQIAYTLRKLAAATQLILDAERQGKRLTLRAALEQAGVKRFVLEKTERQLKMLGRHRGRRLPRWLLQADLDLKGASRGDPRIILERLIVKIADPRLRTPGTLR